MKLRCLSLTLLCAGLLAQATAQTQTQTQAQAPKAWAYFAWWMPQSWRSAPLAQLDRLLFFELKVNASGEISERQGWPEQWADLRSALKQSATPLDLTLTLFGKATFEPLFSSPAAIQRLLDEAQALARHDDVAGLQLDFEIFESLRPQEIEQYRNFVLELAQRLHQQVPRKSLSVFFTMGEKTPLYDAKTLAQVDHVVLQSYDAHWKNSKTAGPVAPLAGEGAVTWEKAVALGLSHGLPRERLLLGFPLYGYEWQVKGKKAGAAALGAGVTTSFAPLAEGLVPAITHNVLDRVRQYGAVHDPVSASSYYQFRNRRGQYFEGWFEDWWSLRRKSDYVVQEKLGGLAFFILGYDDSQLLDYYLKRPAGRPLRGTKE